jgi:hypothetical protein
MFFSGRYEDTLDIRYKILFDLQDIKNKMVDKLREFKWNMCIYLCNTCFPVDSSVSSNPVHQFLAHLSICH